MGQVSALPQWVNLIWMSLSMVTLVGAGIWTIFIFYPYLKAMKEMQIEALKLGRESTRILEGMNDEISPMVDKFHKSLDRADAMVSKVEKKDIFGRVENHLESIRLNIEERSKPLPVVRRPTAARTNGSE
jgi:hypothetical protein